MEFYSYLKELRIKRFKDAKKICVMLGIDKSVWRKIERGINPPPRKSILRKFCILVNALSYEENQLYALARRWKPHADTNTENHILLDPKSRAIDFPSIQEWREVIMEQNRPDYEHKYWGKPTP